MPVTLFFSNRLEALAEKLIENMACGGAAGDDPLGGPRIVVPNTNLARWLKLAIACRRSICMNVAFDFLERGLWRMLADLDPDSGGAAPMEVEVRRALLLAALQQMPEDDRRLEPLRRYLEAAGAAGRVARMWQLSETLARLFSEYELHRADMIERWRKGGAAEDPLEACQQRLYLQLQSLAGESDARGPAVRLLSLSDYARRVFSRARPAGRRQPERVHFFGLSQISSLHLQVLGRLSGWYDMVLYVMNPCREFWEDVATPAEQRWRRRQARRLRILPAEESAGELEQPAGHELLSAWGKPGRESVRRFCALADYDFTESYVGDPPDTVLRAVQHDILTLGQADIARQDLAQDASLQIGACPGIFREVEAVYNSILSNLQRDERLRLTDIAVLVPDMASYKPVLQAVFDRYPPMIAYNLADARAREESRYGQAVLGLLALCRGRFSRREVFDLLLNPCVMQKWGVGPEDVRTWAQWADRLNIFHCFDADEKRARGYTDDVGHTWRQGLLRLRLARVFCEPDPVPDAARGGFPHFRGLVPAGGMAVGEPSLTETFCLLMERLHRGVQRLRGLKAGGLRWRDALGAVCDEMMAVPPDAPAEEAVRRELFRAFEDFAPRGPERGGPSGPLLDVELVAELVKSRLAGIPGGKGDYLTGGVTLCELQPMRPIPFRIVYVLGLQEGNFPGRAPQSSLDLRLRRRRIGDVTLPDRNRYLFLETLLSARERLYLTYVSRDLQKDREIMPASVIVELCRFLEKRILPSGEAFRITQVPLRGSHGDAQRDGGRGPDGDLRANYSWADRLAYYRGAGLWEEALRSSPPEVRAELTRFCPDLHAAAETGQIPAGAQLTLRQLQRFLEDPAQFGMRRHLGLYAEEVPVEALAEEEDEPVFTAYPADYLLTTEPLTWWLEGALAEGVAETAPQRLFDAYYDHMARRGMTPEAEYARLDRRALREQVQARAGQLEQVLANMREADLLYRSLVVGQPAFEGSVSSGRLPVEHFDALCLRLPAQGSQPPEVYVHGCGQWLWRDPDGQWHSLVISGADPGGGKPTRHVIGPVLFYLVSLAHGRMGPWPGEGRFCVHVAHRRCLRKFVYRFDRCRAMKYLEALAAAALDERVSDWMPFETAAKREELLCKDPREISDGDRAEFRDFLRDELEKAEDAHLTRLAVPAIDLRALDRARARLGLFFSTLERK